MNAMIRPSLILHFNLDERSFSPDMVAEIKRCYSYVAPALVESHEAGQGAAEHALTLTIKLHRPYWDVHDEASQQLWAGVMTRWLHNMFSKVSNTIVASNKVRLEKGKEPLTYAWVDVQFDSHARLSVKTGTDGSIPATSVDWTEHARTLLCDGVLGAEVACVRIPSRASYVAQRAAAVAAAAQVGEAPAEAGAPGRMQGPATDLTGAPESSVASAGAQTSVAADSVAPVAAPADGADASDACDALTSGADATADPSFDVDYSVWGIEYADGSVRAFDSSAGRFVS